MFTWIIEKLLRIIDTSAYQKSDKIHYREIGNLERRRENTNLKLSNEDCGHSDDKILRSQLSAA